MLVETTQLTTSHVDLGSLDEASLLPLFGTAMCYRILGDECETIRDVKNAEGQSLYPAYYLTHLKVPLECPLNQFTVWDTVSVGVEISVYGRMILDSRYVLGWPDEIPEELEDLEEDALPTMNAEQMFYIEEHEGDPRPSAPVTMADLPKLLRKPANAERFEQVALQGTLDPHFDPNLKLRPITYPLLVGRDAAPQKNMLFATFVKLLALGENLMLSNCEHPFVPSSVVSHQNLVERETFYFGNCQGGRTLRICSQARVDSIGDLDVDEEAAGGRVLGMLTFISELHTADTNSLLAASRARKAIVIPTDQSSDMAAARRLVAQCGK